MFKMILILALAGPLYAYGTTDHGWKNVLVMDNDKANKLTARVAHDRQCKQVYTPNGYPYRECNYWIALPTEPVEVPVPGTLPLFGIAGAAMYARRKL